MEDATAYLSLSPRFEYERIALDRRLFREQRAIDMLALEGLVTSGRWEEWVSHERRAMVHQLIVEILTHEGGAKASDWVVAELAVRPRWFPKFLWRRMPTRRVRWEIEATPEWIWPFATVRLPESLGRPVEFMVTKTTKTEE